MRLIFLGSGAFGLPTLMVLHEEHEVVAVVTQPDKPAGRKRQLTATPIGQWAQEQGLTVLKFSNVNEDSVIQQIQALKPDAAVVIAFGQKLSESLIESLGQLAVNLHASLLPRYRGAAPINWAMIHGEAQTGVSVIGLAQKMDAGEVYASAATEIEPDETAGELHDRLAGLGPRVVLKVLHELDAETLSAFPQDESLATLAPKLSKADGTVDFSASAKTIRNRVHGLTPWPGVRVRVCGQSPKAPEALKLLRVSVVAKVISKEPAGTVLADGHVVAGDGNVLRLDEIQPPGKKPMAFTDFLRGRSIQIGDRFEAWS